MSSFPKFKIPTDDVATPATVTTFRPKNSRNTESSNRDGLILKPEQWFPVLRAFILQYHREHPDHDRVWLREHHHELYRRIVAQENLIDGLRIVRFPELMDHLKEWRRLMVQAEFATAVDVRGLFGGEIGRDG